MNVIKKNCFLLTLSLLFSHISYVHAHAVVTKESLKIAPIHTGKTSQVTLDFNSQIELGLSRFFLVSSNDKHEAVETSLGEKPGQVILSLPSLESGEYALRYKVFATDGHISTDIIRFTVNP